MFVSKLRMWPALFCAGLIGLGGCAERAVNVLVPENVSAPGASKVDMLIKTTRLRTTVPGEIYSGERARDASLFNLVVSIPPDKTRKAGEVQWPKKLPADPATEFTTVAARDMDRPEAQQWFKQVAGPKKQLFVFVHGFNNTFEDAAYRFAQVVHDSGTDAAPVLFTWPSRGSAFDYLYDKESATYSRDALEDLLTRAATSPNVSDITVMAHSMGNWVMIEALRQMAIRHGSVYPKIKNVIMAAPDVDVDVFRSDFLALPEPRPKITVFVSADDRALALSRRLSGGIDRLGAIDPDVEPYRTKLAANNITVIDLTKVSAGDRLNHGKFAASPEVVKLIGGRLINGQQINDGDLSIGEKLAGATAGAAGAIGQTVGAVVSAPLAVFDPNTRRNYGRQLQSVDQGWSNAVQPSAQR